MSNVLSGITVDRKVRRVAEVLDGLAQDLQDFKSEASETYVKSEEFEDLLEHALQRVTMERSEEKRRLLRGFLLDAIRRPDQNYNEQIELLRILDRLQPAHLEIIKALLAPPEGQNVISGSPLDTLQRRLPDMHGSQIETLMAQLADMRLVTPGSLKVMMTGPGSENLAHKVTPFGRRFLDFLVE